MNHISIDFLLILFRYLFRPIYSSSKGLIFRVNGFFIAVQLSIELLFIHFLMLFFGFEALVSIEVLFMFYLMYSEVIAGLFFDSIFIITVS
jgi:hypothetical protein